MVVKRREIDDEHEPITKAGMEISSGILIPCSLNSVMCPIATKRYYKDTINIVMIF